MKPITIDFRTLGFVVGTRALLGVGIGLLLSLRLPRDSRRRAGLALVGLGAATTVPALLAVRRGASRLPS